MDETRFEKVVKWIPLTILVAVIVGAFTLGAIRGWGSDGSDPSAGQTGHSEGFELEAAESDARIAEAEYQEAQYDEGYHDGYYDGYDEGSDEGYNAGYEASPTEWAYNLSHAPVYDGYAEGYDPNVEEESAGYVAGYDDGYDAGYGDGYDEGFEFGYTDAGGYDR